MSTSPARNGLTLTLVSQLTLCGAPFNYYRVVSVAGAWGFSARRAAEEQSVDEVEASDLSRG